MDWWQERQELWCKDTVDGTVVAGCLGPEPGVQTYLDWLLSAWGWTLAVAGIGLLVALVVGSAVGVARTTPYRALVLLGHAWTELFRNIPLIVQLFLWYFVVPEFVPPLKAMPSVVLAGLGLGFFTSARISEQVRAGIESIPKGQRYAALAMGLTLPQTYRHVLLPVAFRVIMPTLTSEGMNVVKNSSVAFAISVLELTQFARQVGEETSRPIETYLVVTALYFVSAFAVFLAASALERAVRVPGVAAGGGR
ncbi:MAG: amino acid ABC transporter permease [Inhella sp.]|jgi:glutamate/aspartate transport system permease protein|uniref:amino acid ABC transporter permease n=1 Tax=Inhella sp. TaxID=1921806 RepID=UPI00391A6A85